MKCTLPVVSWLLAVLILVVSSGCRSNPNIEGARLDLRNKDYQRALTNINRALENEPNNAEAFLLKGDILSEMLPQVLDEAERAEYFGELMGAYSEAVRLNPEHQLHVSRQHSALYRNEFALAMETYRDADQLGGQARANLFTTSARYFRNASMILPDSVSALINEAHAYYNAGRAREASDAYELAIALGHTNRDIFIYLARTYELMAVELADPDTKPEYLSQMVRTLKTAWQHHPNDGEIRKLLLNAYAMSEVTAEALPFFEEIYSAEQDNRIYLYNYGTLLMHQGDYEGAIRMLSSAVELDSSYANALFNLGAAHVNLGIQFYKNSQALEDSLQANDGRITPTELERMEARKEAAEQSKLVHLTKGIAYLEPARDLLEDDLSDLGSVCHALFLAYAQTNQRSRAAEASLCAKQSGR